MDVLLLIVDSLRAHPFADGTVASTPFLNSLRHRSVSFERAYATECWTLPSHASMFTGLMPSEHGAHFQTMAYSGAAPTLAQSLSEQGYNTELATRNFVFDGTIAGINRGFARCTRLVSDVRRWDPTPLFLALSKPRVRRHLRNTGFFHADHRADREFLRAFAQTLRPADDLLLAYLIRRLSENRRAGARSFLFANLYDVHAPYAPRAGSLLRPWRSPAGIAENLLAPYALSRLGEHRYLRADFSLPDLIRRILQERYRAAVELMDGKLALFFRQLAEADLLDDTLVILTGDHGEGFGEHGLFLHDASVYETHLHVPLWILAPGMTPTSIDEVVSTRHLFDLVLGMVGGAARPAILDAEFRARHPVAFAQHYHYPHLRDAMPRYRVNQFAAVGKHAKLVCRGGAWTYTDLRSDSREERPQPLGPGDVRAELLAAEFEPSAIDEVDADCRRLAALVQ